MPKIVDKFWLWTHEAGSWNNQYKIKGISRMTPVEAAFYMGIPNIIMVRYGNKPEPSMFEQYAISFTTMKKVVWSVIGDSSTTNDDTQGEDEISLVSNLAKDFPNINAVIMDDFFTGRRDKFTPQVLSEMKNKLNGCGRKLDLWATLYTQEMDLPIKEHLKQCDVIAFWTWHAPELENLEKNFSRLKEMSPKSRVVLGCYMYDFGNGETMPVNLMEKQCELGLRWLEEGQIEGMIFLGSCICDLKMEAVKWSREWIRKKAGG